MALKEGYSAQRTCVRFGRSVHGSLGWSVNRWLSKFAGRWPGRGDGEPPSIRFKGTDVEMLAANTCVLIVSKEVTPDGLCQRAKENE